MAGIYDREKFLEGLIKIHSEEFPFIARETAAVAKPHDSRSMTEIRFCIPRRRPEPNRGFLNIFSSGMGLRSVRSSICIDINTRVSLIIIFSRSTCERASEEFFLIALSR